LSRSIVGNDQQLDSLEEKNPKVKRLLRDGNDPNAAKLGYEDLLSMSFDDVDFAVETVTNVKHKNILKFATAKLKSIITTSTSGKVSFTRSNGNDAKSTVISWNNASEASYKINESD